VRGVGHSSSQSDVYGLRSMALEPSVVTVTGPDRSALLTDLTLRFGHIELVSEREIILPGGGRGHELTVRHRPFTSELGQVAPPPPPLSPPPPEPVAVAPPVAHETAVEPPVEPEHVPDGTRQEAEQILDQAREQARQALDQGRADAEQLRVDAREEAERMAASLAAERERVLAEAREEAERMAAQLREEAQRARDEAVAGEDERIRAAVDRRLRELEREGADKARAIVQAAQQEAARIAAAAEQELAAARTEARGITREAREQADALLRESRAQVDLATVEGRALTEAVRDAQQRLRDLGNQLTTQLQAAQKDLADRTTLHSVQARLRAGGGEGSAAEIADHLARLLRGGGTRDAE
jgi:hypothetical protein